MQNRWKDTKNETLQKNSKAQQRGQHCVARAVLRKQVYLSCFGASRLWLAQPYLWISIRSINFFCRLVTVMVPLSSLLMQDRIGNTGVGNLKVFFFFFHLFACDIALFSCLSLNHHWLTCSVKLKHRLCTLWGILENSMQLHTRYRFKLDEA